MTNPEKVPDDAIWHVRMPESWAQDTGWLHSFRRRIGRKMEQNVYTSARLVEELQSGIINGEWQVRRDGSDCWQTPRDIVDTLPPFDPTMPIPDFSAPSQPLEKRVINAALIVVLVLGLTAAAHFVPRFFIPQHRLAAFDTYIRMANKEGTAGSASRRGISFSPVLFEFWAACAILGLGAYFRSLWHNDTKHNHSYRISTSNVLVFIVGLIGLIVYMWMVLGWFIRFS